MLCPYIIILLDFQIIIKWNIKQAWPGGAQNSPTPIQPTPLGSGKSSSAYTRVLCMHQNLTNQAHHPSRPGPGPGCWRSLRQNKIKKKEFNSNDLQTPENKENNLLINTVMNSLLAPRLRQQPGPGPGRLGWLAWFKMLLAWGGGVGGRGPYFISFLRKTQKCTFSYKYALFIF